MKHNDVQANMIDVSVLAYRLRVTVLSYVLGREAWVVLRNVY
jgi:hypothetical protein